MHTVIKLSIKRSFLFFAVLTLLSCSVNPVTGEKELAWMNEGWEINTGKQYYGFQQQAGGGKYSIDPDLSAYVRSVGNKLSQFSVRSHLPYEFVVLNDSSPNAWALPGGKIAINRGLLLELHDEAELAAVLAHEIVHADARHSAQSQELGSMISVGQMAASALLQKSGHNSPALQQGIGYSGLYGQTRYSRSRELEADKYGMAYMRKAGYDPSAAINLQQTFVRLSQGQRSDIFSLLFASHPPSQARVNANILTATQLTAGGLRNKSRFQLEIAQLVKRKPAYDLAEKAKQALTNKKYKEAITLTEKAIKIEPKEGRFYELKGIALNELNRARDALQAFNQSISLDAGYFRPMLRRGLLKYELKSFSDAEQDFITSLSLAPTQIAYLKLGEIAENKEDCGKAKEHYQNAMQAGGKHQQTLQNKLAALQLSCP